MITKSVGCLEFSSKHWWKEMGKLIYSEQTTTANPTKQNQETLWNAYP